MLDFYENLEQSVPQTSHKLGLHTKCSKSYYKGMRLRSRILVKTFLQLQAQAFDYNKTVNYSFIQSYTLYGMVTLYIKDRFVKQTFIFKRLNEFLLKSVKHISRRVHVSQKPVKDVRANGPNGLIHLSNSEVHNSLFVPPV